MKGGKYRSGGGKKHYNKLWEGETKYYLFFNEGYQQRIDELMVSIKTELDEEFKKYKNKQRK